jgi:lactate dehydrogenase-like 2-hydroxyacid dehydrogenase
MTTNDGIVDVSTGRIGRQIGMVHSTANVKQIIYYNAENVVLHIDEIYNVGTYEEKAYRQIFYYSDVTNSGIDHTTTIWPWERI